MAVARTRFLSHPALNLAILIFVTAIVGFARPIPDLDQRLSESYIRVSGWREWRHLPLWQPYVETGQQLPLPIDPVFALPQLTADYATAVSISTVLATLLAGLGGWLLMRLARQNHPISFLFGVACAAVFEKDYAFLWLLVGIVGIAIGGVVHRRAMVTLAVLSAVLWLAAGGLTALATIPVIYIALILITLVIIRAHKYRSAPVRWWKVVNTTTIIVVVGLCAFIALQRWMSELASRQVPIATSSSVLLACLNHLQSNVVIPFLSVAAPDDPRLALEYLTRRIRRESAATIEYQAPYAIAFDKNAAIDLRARGYIEMKRSPRLSTTDPQHCLYTDFSAPGYAFVLPLNNSSRAIPLVTFIHALDYIALRVEVNPSQTNRIVVSERAANGWQVWIDGKPETLDPYGGLLSVVLARGSTVRDIVFQYRPPDSMAAAAAIFAGSILATLYLLRTDRLLPTGLRQSLINTPLRLMRRLHQLLKRLYAVLMTPVSGDE